MAEMVLMTSSRFDFVALMALTAELLYSNTQLIIIFFKFFLFYSVFFLYLCIIKKIKDMTRQEKIKHIERKGIKVLISYVTGNVILNQSHYPVFKSVNAAHKYLFGY